MNTKKLTTRQFIKLTKLFLNVPYVDQFWNIEIDQSMQRVKALGYYDQEIAGNLVKNKFSVEVRKDDGAIVFTRSYIQIVLFSKS